jgi:hypothetical protein
MNGPREFQNLYCAMDQSPQPNSNSGYLPTDDEMVSASMSNIQFLMMFHIDQRYSIWNKNKSVDGLLAQYVVFNFICQLIIFVYLLDNNTSWVILASSELVPVIKVVL